MANLSAINHINFARLHDITNNYNKATLLDKLVFWWQISTYTLDDNKIWFTRSLNQISEDAKISKRSVERYLHEFEEAGFIEKTNKLFKKKNLYIRITEKLLLLLVVQPESVESTNRPSIIVETDMYHSKPIDDTGNKHPPHLTSSSNNTIINNENKKSSDLFLNQIGGTDHANLAVSIYKDQDLNLKNNNSVSTPDIVNKFKNKQSQNIPKLKYAIETDLNDLITPQFKKYILGMLSNMQTQHQLVFSNPEQLFAEVVFSVLNKDNQFPGIQDNQHRVNLIAKLLREKRWKTPKGFYNHWDIGSKFKKKKTLQEHAYFESKNEEIYNEKPLKSHDVAYFQKRNGHSSQDYAELSITKAKQSEYRNITNLINTETKYLHDMEAQFIKTSNSITAQVVQNTKQKLIILHKKAEELYSLLHKQAA